MRAFLIGAVLSFAVLPGLATSQDGNPPLGDARLDLDAAISAFQSVCIDSLPRFERSTKVLAKQSYAQNTATGTWYHPLNEVSFSLEPWDGRPICSMVFASDERASTLGLAMAVAASDSGDVGFDPTTGAASATAQGGAVMEFSPGGGGQSNLHRAVLLASE